jgi:hypothetical protein
MHSFSEGFDEIIFHGINDVVISIKQESCILPSLLAKMSRGLRIPQHIGRNLPAYKMEFGSRVLEQQKSLKVIRSTKY